MPGSCFSQDGRGKGLGRIEEVSSSFGPIAGACIACLEITKAG